MLHRSVGLAGVRKLHCSRQIRVSEIISVNCLHISHERQIDLNKIHDPSDSTYTVPRTKILCMSDNSPDAIFINDVSNSCTASSPFSFPVTYMFFPSQIKTDQ